MDFFIIVMPIPIKLIMFWRFAMSYLCLVIESRFFSNVVQITLFFFAAPFHHLFFINLINNVQEMVCFIGVLG